MCRCSDPLAACNHRFHQIFVVLETGDDDPKYMHNHEPESEIGTNFVNLLDPPGAPEGIGRHRVAGCAGSAHHDEKRDDHGTACRIMPEVAWRPEHGDVAQIGENFARRPYEAGTSRWLRSDEAPDKADGDKTRYRIAGGDVKALDLIAGRVGHQ